MSDRLQVMESKVREMVPEVEFALRQGDLFSITKAERDALLDAMATGADFPFVLLDGVVVHTGDLSPGPVAAALARHEG